MSKIRWFFEQVLLDGRDVVSSMVRFACRTTVNIRRLTDWGWLLFVCLWLLLFSVLTII